MGLRPNLSLKLPIRGANINWVIAYANVSQPPYFAASLTSPCINSLISFGITGIIIRQPVISINIVMKIKPIAACFLFDAINSILLVGQINKKSRLISQTGFYYIEIKLFYNSNAFLALPPINNSNGFSKASFTATKKPTDSRPSIILWS